MKNIIIDKTVLIDRDLAGACTIVINAMVSAIVAFLYLLLYLNNKTIAALEYEVPSGYQAVKDLIFPYMFLFPSVFFICGVLLFLRYRHISVGAYFIYVSLYLFSALMLFLYVILNIFLAHVAHLILHIDCYAH